MSRKYRSTEISFDVPADDDGQHVHYNMFCVNCHCLGTKGIERHYPDCTLHESYAVITAAEVPRRNASKRAWDIFKRQFVYVRVHNWWSGFYRSWYARIKQQTQ